MLIIWPFEVSELCRSAIRFETAVQVQTHLQHFPAYDVSWKLLLHCDPVLTFFAGALPHENRWKCFFRCWTWLPSFFICHFSTKPVDAPGWWTLTCDAHISLHISWKIVRHNQDCSFAQDCESGAQAILDGWGRNQTLLEAGTGAWRSAAVP